jgi:hypothetical protein
LARETGALIESDRAAHCGITGHVGPDRWFIPGAFLIFKSEKKFGITTRK